MKTLRLAIFVITFFSIVLFNTTLCSAESVTNLGPNARAVVWPDVAHMIGMEAPDRLNALILDFLAPLAPWA